MITHKRSSSVPARLISSIKETPQFKKISDGKTALLIDLDGTLISEKKDLNPWHQKVNKKMIDFLTYALIGGNPIEIVTDSSFERAQFYHCKLATEIEQKLFDLSINPDKYQMITSPEHFRQLKSENQLTGKPILYFGLNALQHEYKENLEIDAINLNQRDNARPQKKAKCNLGKAYRMSFDKINQLLGYEDFNQREQNTQEFAKVMMIGNAGPDIIDGTVSFPRSKPIYDFDSPKGHQNLIIIALPEDRPDLLEDSLSPDNLTKHINFGDIKSLESLLRP